MTRQYTREYLEPIVKNSLSINMVVMNIMQLKDRKVFSAGTYQNIKKLITEYDIDISHFDKSLGPRKGHKVIRYTDEEVFVKNATFNTRGKTHGPSVRKRLIRLGFNDAKCDICGLEHTWNNQPITMQLDHINGDHFDNTLENLRFLCPNCHTQTETYNKGLKTRKETIINDEKKNLVGSG